MEKRIEFIDLFENVEIVQILRNFNTFELAIFSVLIVTILLVLWFVFSKLGIKSGSHIGDGSDDDSGCD
jgi:hypothetical protein